MRGLLFHRCVGVGFGYKLLKTEIVLFFCNTSNWFAAHIPNSRSCSIVRTLMNNRWCSIVRTLMNNCKQILPVTTQQLDSLVHWPGIDLTFSNIGQAIHSLTYRLGRWVKFNVRLNDSRLRKCYRVKVKTCRFTSGCRPHEWDPRFF